MKLSFRKKLFLPLLVSWLCLLLVSVVNIWQTKALRLEERIVALKFATETGMSTVKEFAELASKGVLPLEEAKKQALDRVRALRYGDDGYFTVINSQPTVLLHPIKPELEGKDMSGFVDTAGFPVYKAVAEIAKGKGEGWIDYVWPKPGADQKKSYPKGAYVLTYKPWDMTFIAGVYIDDLTDAFVADLIAALIELSLMLAVLTAIVLATIRSIERTIGGDPDEAADVARRIAQGDLTENVTTKPGDTTSLMVAIKTMRDNLLDIVSRVRTGTDAIATASREIASGNQDLSARTESQASSLEETAASTEELSTTVKQNAENALEANSLSGAASNVATKGGEVIGRVVTTMGEINESAQKIVQIIGVIDGIAFQTNILALNAAVEAARAGEQGRGFAVVAQEVRTLAQRSASAAKEIKALIDTSVERVETGAALVNDAGTTMTDIVESVEKVKNIIGEISTASQEQTSGIDQIHQAISQMDEVTQQNAALVEQAAAAAQALQDQAAKLEEVVSVFKLDVTSTHGLAPQPSHTPTLPPSNPKRSSARAASLSRPGTNRPARSPMPARKMAVPPSGDWEEF